MAPPLSINKMPMFFNIKTAFAPAVVPNRPKPQTSFFQATMLDRIANARQGCSSCGH